MSPEPETSSAGHGSNLKLIFEKDRQSDQPNNDDDANRPCREPDITLQLAFGFVFGDFQVALSVVLVRIAHGFS